MRVPEIFSVNFENITITTFKVGRNGLANFIYAVTDRVTGDTVLIDPGWEHDLIVSKILKSGWRLVAILLTHADEDHTSGVDRILQSAQVPVYLSDLEKCPENLAACRITPIGHLDVLCLGSIRALCLHTPGHSPGSFCFKIENLVFTGDTLFNEGCGYCEPPLGSVEDMFQSIGLLQQHVSDEMVVFPAHQYKSSPGLAMGKIRRINPYLRIKNLESFVVFSQRRLVHVPGMEE